MIDLVKKIIVVLAIAALGYSGYKSYVIREILDGASANAPENVKFTHGIIACIPFGPIYIFNINVTITGDTQARLHASRIVLHRWINDDERIQTEGAIIGLDTTHLVWPPKILAQQNSVIDEITGNHPVTEALFAPLLESIAPTSGLLPTKLPRIADYNIRFHVDKKKHEINVYQHEDRHDLGLLELSATLSFTDSWSLHRIPQATLVKAFVRYEDQGFMKYHNDYRAKQQKLTPEQWLATLKDQLDKDVHAQKIKLWPHLHDSINQYLAQPNYIQMDLAPEKPLPLSHIQHYRGADLPALLNLSVSLRPE
jgi:hypothetical protein